MTEKGNVMTKLNASLTVESKPYTIREDKTTVKCREYSRFIVDFGKDNQGSRIRKSYKTKAKAVAAIREQVAKDRSRAERDAILKRMIGQKAERLSADDLLDAVQGLEILKGRAKIAEAAAFYVRHTTPPGGEDRTIKELVEEYTASKVKANRSPYTIRDIRHCMGAFARAFSERKVAEISTSEIESWYDEQIGGPARRIKRRNYLVSIFNYAVKRKYCRENPADPIDVPKQTKTTPRVLTVKESESLLRYAAANEPDMIPYFTMCLFAGIRPIGEIQRLDWKEIRFQDKEIFISAEASKTGDERYVEMKENLIAWLAPYRKHNGPIFFSRLAFERVRTGAGVRWSKDCMRHTFGSMHVAMWENMGATMEQMGHTNARIFKNHYRRAVRKEDAEQFWSIRPESGKQTLRFPVPKAG